MSSAPVCRARVSPAPVPRAPASSGVTPRTAPPSYRAWPHYEPDIRGAASDVVIYESALKTSLSFESVSPGAL